jgi:hypothetical protein
VKNLKQLILSCAVVLSGLVVLTPALATKPAPTKSKSCQVDPKKGRMTCKKGPLAAPKPSAAKAATERD